MKVRLEVVGIIRNLIRKEKFFKQTEPKKRNLLKETFEKLKEIYSVTGKLKFEQPGTRTGTGTSSRYCISKKQIILDKPSLVNFLHEFRHLLQYQTKIKVTNVEVDAREWSLNVFKKASPKAYENAVQKGLLLYTLDNYKEDSSRRNCFFIRLIMN